MIEGGWGLRRWQHFKIARWQDGKMARWQDGKMARWQDGKMARWQDGKMARLATSQHGNMATWQHGNMATWQDDKVAYLPLLLLVDPPYLPICTLRNIGLGKHGYGISVYCSIHNPLYSRIHRRRGRANPRLSKPERQTPSRNSDTCYPAEEITSLASEVFLRSDFVGMGFYRVGILGVMESMLLETNKNKRMQPRFSSPPTVNAHAHYL
eukprot:1392229-Amorphochlora_amoeboformis.AAC.2